MLSGPLVRVHNPTIYPIIGKGSQGAVFKLSTEHCVKIYPKKENTIKEAGAYLKAKGLSITPKIYEIGQNYIVMEFINGLSLKDYLSKNGKMTPDITKKILFLFGEIRKCGFPRQDLALRHIFINARGELKVVDIVHALKKSKSGPKILFKELKELGLLDLFLEQAKKVDISLYLEWKKSLSKYFIKSKNVI